MSGGMVLLAILVAGAAAAVVLAQTPPGQVRGSWDPEAWLRYPVIATLMGRLPDPDAGPSPLPMSRPAHVRDPHPHRQAGSRRG